LCSVHFLFGAFRFFEPLILLSLGEDSVNVLNLELTHTLSPGYPQFEKTCGKRLIFIGRVVERAEITLSGPRKFLASEMLDFRPERFQVGISQSQRLDSISAADHDRALEPDSRGLQHFELAGVAREIVRNDRFGGEFVEGGQQCGPCFPDAALGNAPERISLMQPARSSVRRVEEQLAGNLQTFDPVFFRDTNVPAQFQDSWMGAKLGANVRQLGFGFGNIAQANPAICGRDIKQFRRLEFHNLFICHGNLYFKLLPWESLLLLIAHGLHR